MARLAYTLLLWLLLPFIFPRLAWRARRQPEYLQHIGERFGNYGKNSGPAQPTLWLHAVSVGETRAAQPLVRALLQRYPGHTLVLTCMTPTGRAAAQEIHAADGARITCIYLPYDYPFAVRRFLRRFQPVAGLIMETEVWPNLVAGCAAAGVPLALVNARLSARSAAGYRRFAALARPTFAGLTAITAQSEGDRARLLDVGAREVQVTGNLKFDVSAAPELVARGMFWRDLREAGADGAPRRMLLAASTREGEEALLLDALAPLVRAGVLLAIVPRHPQRFDEVARLIESRGYALARRSAGESVTTATQVWLGDSMGEMPAYYVAADCAYIGGSLLPFGGQNLIEACALGCPVLVGPHTYNFTQAAELAVEAGAALRVADANQLAGEAQRLLQDEGARLRMGEAGKTFTETHRGASVKTMQMVEALLAK
ncbi:MAG: Three-deoxy-D-manno-octulosonic-acid transferase domain protein [Betaproteobacteria bacterium]|nr:Three-deoxy-D-manno-octulosonic-acid transferase domain protein [Betaproteobacteria bacterium]